MSLSDVSDGGYLSLLLMISSNLPIGEKTQIEKIVFIIKNKKLHKFCAHCTGDGIRGAKVS